MQVLLPGYKPVMAKLVNPVRMMEFDDLFGVRAMIMACRMDGVQYLVLDAPDLFDRDGGPYTDASGTDHPDNWRRFAALCRAAASIAEDGTGRMGSRRRSCP
jgi:starch synthase